MSTPIEKLKAHIRSLHPSIVYTGKTDVNDKKKKVTSDQLWKSFRHAHPEIVPNGAKVKPIYQIFCDEWVLRALTEIHAEDLGQSVDETSPMQRIRKKRGSLKIDGQEEGERCIAGWQWTTQEANRGEDDEELPRADRRERAAAAAEARAVRPHAPANEEDQRRERCAAAAEKRQREHAENE